jgi:hypothetical protein
MKLEHRLARFTACCGAAAIALLAVGCSLATSLDGLSGGPGPVSDTTDASTDEAECPTDAPLTSDTWSESETAVEESGELSETSASSDANDAWQESFDAPRDGADDWQEVDACTPDRCAPPCANGVQDGRETAIDCGGGCAPCPTGQPCLVASDCQSKVCTVASPVTDAPIADAAEIEGGFLRDADSETYKICQAPSCLDRVQNAEETDVDCGGSCPTCPPGAACRSWADCQSKLCAANRCTAPTCNDSVVNGNETAVDCGGSCPGCQPGQACADSSDCISGVCKAQTCAAPTCLDGVKNGAESDVDCGGGACPPCLVGRRCNGAADCASGLCRGNTCRTN